MSRWPKSVVRRSGKEEPDPQDLKEADVRLVVERAIPFQTWKLRQGMSK